jgi:hypothetical protein
LPTTNTFSESLFIFIAYIEQYLGLSPSDISAPFIKIEGVPIKVALFLE